MTPNERFAHRTFFWAAVYGVIAVVPQYFLEGVNARLFPPPINHPEHFYGFLGIALAWQWAFFAIAKEPVKLRPIMLPAIAEKWLFAAACFVLIALGRAPADLIVPAAIDVIFGVLFFVSYRRLN